MIIYTRHVTPYGFKANSMFIDTKSANSYYIIEPEHSRVTGILNFSGGNTLFRFNLTSKQFKQYMAGKISLVPPGCCAPARGNSQLIEKCEILSDVELKNVRELRTLLESHGYIAKK